MSCTLIPKKETAMASKKTEKKREEPEEETTEIVDPQRLLDMARALEAPAVRGRK